MTFPYAEHHIQIAMRLFVRQGDVVYDVGANKGWLTKPLSDLVGVSGHVMAFEASGRNLNELSEVARSNPFANTTVIDAAVYHTSGQSMEFYENTFSNTDGLYTKGHGAVVVSVRTITLDDFFASNQAKPKFIKADIEGAEFDMLKGAVTLIETCRPIFVLEMRPGDGRCWTFLRDRGYIAFSLLTFVELETEDQIKTGPDVSDYIFLPDEEKARFFRTKPFHRDEVSIEQESSFLELSVPLKAGINKVRFYGSGNSFADPVLFQIVHNGRTVVVAINQAQWMFQSPPECLIYSQHEELAQAYFVQRSGSVYIEKLVVETVALPEAERHQLDDLSCLLPLGSTLPPPSREEIAAPVEVVSPTILPIDLVRAGPYLVLTFTTDEWYQTIPPEHRRVGEDQLAALALQRGRTTAVAFGEDAFRNDPGLRCVAHLASTYKEITLCDVSTHNGIAAMNMARMAGSKTCDARSFAFDARYNGSLAPCNFANNGLEITFESAVVASFDGYKPPVLSEVHSNGSGALMQPVRCIRLDKYLADRNAVRPACIRFHSDGAGQTVLAGLRSLFAFVPTILDFSFSPWLLRTSNIDPTDYIEGLLESHIILNHGTRSHYTSAATIVGEIDAAPPFCGGLLAISRSLNGVDGLVAFLQAEAKTP